MPENLWNNSYFDQIIDGSEFIWHLLQVVVPFLLLPIKTVNKPSGWESNAGPSAC